MIIAVDTGGTKTLVIAFSDNGQPLNRQKFPTPKNQNDYLKAVSDAIIGASNGQKISGVSIALPGVIRHNKAVVCKNLDWYNFDVIEALQADLPNVPMWLENDANLGGLGAARLLDPQPRRSLYVTVSTGVGGGFVVEGKIEPNIAENELGDMTLEYNGRLAYWEELAGGEAIMRDYGVYASELSDPIAISEVAKRIARGLMALLPVLNPDIVAIGGGVGAHFDMFASDVNKELAFLPQQYHCPIVTAPFPEEIVAYGCYFYAKDQLDTSTEPA